MTTCPVTERGIYCYYNSFHYFFETHSSDYLHVQFWWQLSMLTPGSISNESIANDLCPIENMSCNVYIYLYVILNSFCSA